MISEAWISGVQSFDIAQNQLRRRYPTIKNRVHQDPLRRETRVDIIPWAKARARSRLLPWTVSTPPGLTTQLLLFQAASRWTPGAPRARCSSPGPMLCDITWHSIILYTISILFLDLYTIIYTLLVNSVILLFLPRRIKGPRLSVRALPPAEAEKPAPGEPITIYVTTITIAITSTTMYIYIYIYVHNSIITSITITTITTIINIIIVIIIIIICINIIHVTLARSRRARREGAPRDARGAARRECMCNVCVYIYIYIYTHTYIYTHIYIIL